MKKVLIIAGSGCGCLIIIFVFFIIIGFALGWDKDSPQHLGINEQTLANDSLSIIVEDSTTYEKIDEVIHINNEEDKVDDFAMLEENLEVIKLRQIQEQEQSQMPNIKQSQQTEIKETLSTKSKPLAKFTSAELYNAIDTDRIAFNNKYHNEWIEVTAVIIEFYEDSINGRSIRFPKVKLTQDMKLSVNFVYSTFYNESLYEDVKTYLFLPLYLTGEMEMKDRHKTKLKFKEGDTITFVGRYEKDDFNIFTYDVYMKEASIIKVNGKKI